MKCMTLTLPILVALCQTLQASLYTMDKLLEIYVVVDKKVLDNYEQYGLKGRSPDTLVEEDVNYVLRQVQQVFDHPKLEIRVMANIVVLKKDIIGRGDIAGKDGIHDKAALKTFEEFLKEKSTVLSKYYDMAILFTGYDLYDQDNQDVKVGAYRATICDPKALAVVELDGTYNSVFYTARAIGLVLGLPEEQDSTSLDHYIMGGKQADSTVLSLSPKSHRKLSQVLKRICLQNWLNYKWRGEMNPTDLMFEVDIICKRFMRTKHSFMCKERQYYSGSPPQGGALCQVMFCYDPSTGDCKRAIPPEGLVCGQSKQCRKGKCVPGKPRFSRFHDSRLRVDCLFGDMEAEGLSRFTPDKKEAEYCSKSSQCYTKLGRDRCCQSCLKAKNQDDPGCPYGDYSRYCHQFTQKEICGNFSRNCCHYCGATNKDHYEDDKIWQADDHKLDRMLKGEHWISDKPVELTWRQEVDYRMQKIKLGHGQRKTDLFDNRLIMQYLNNINTMALPTRCTRDYTPLCWRFTRQEICTEFFNSCCNYCMNHYHLKSSESESDSTGVMEESKLHEEEKRMRVRLNDKDFSPSRLIELRQELQPTG